MKQLIKAIEKVNYYEAAEGQAYAREGGARRRAYLNLIEIAREHSDAEIEEALDEVGVILFNEDLLIGKPAEEINTSISVGCPAGGTRSHGCTLHEGAQLNGGEK